MKKLCFVVTTPFVANAFLESHLLALSKSYEVLLCVNVDAYPLSPALQENVRVLDVHIERKISLLQDIKTLFDLLLILGREKPSAIHSVTPKAGLLAMMAGFFMRTPRRYHTFTGQVWATKTGMRRSVLKIFDHLIIAFSTRVFSDSPSQNRFLESEGIAEPGQISILGNSSIAGVNLERFHPDAEIRAQMRAKMKIGDDAIVFLFVGRINKDKGLRDLVSAHRKITGTRPTAALWIVGPDDDGLGAQLLAEGKSDPAPVRWVGATDQPEKYMTAADILVLPSYREGFGQVIIEAAASGIPTIAYRIDGVIDAVVDQHTGLLVPTGDVEALAVAMDRLAKDSALRKSLGSQALVGAQTAFSSCRITAEWVAFYQKEVPV